MSTEAVTATAYQRIVGKLHDLDLRPRISGSQTTARCPSHDDRQASFAVYDKGGKAKIVCFAGCDDALDILPALDMTVADLYDEPRSSGNARKSAVDPDLIYRTEARKAMTPAQRAIDDLLQLPDLDERLCMGIARMRPELYIWERENLADEEYLPNAVDAPGGAKYMAVIERIERTQCTPATSLGVAA